MKLTVGVLSRVSVFALEAETLTAKRMMSSRLRMGCSRDVCVFVHDVCAAIRSCCETVSVDVFSRIVALRT